MSRKRNRDIYEMFQAGMTISEIASEYNLSRSRTHQIIRAVAHRNDLPVRKRLRRRTMTTSLLSPAIRKAYVEGHIPSVIDLAKKLSISYTTARRLVREAKLVQTGNPVNKSIYEMFQTMTAREIANKLSISVDAVRQRILHYRRRHNLPIKRDNDNKESS